ncbi:MAG: hypothetical protein ACYDHP_08220 [Ferrimicrobium sp.]
MPESPAWAHSIPTLFHPGQSVMVGFTDGQVSHTTVEEVNNDTVHLHGFAPVMDGEVEISVVFLAERYRSRGVLRTSRHGTLLSEISHPERVNIRSAPRISVDLDATYYLHPPAIGVPIRICDLSITGVTFTPPDVEAHPQIRHYISFTLDGRHIRTIVEIVDATAELWRARILAIGAADEAAIAAFTLKIQAGKRHHLDTAELAAISTLDIEDRVRYPLIDSLVSNDTTLTIAAGETTTTIPCEVTDKAAVDRIANAIVHNARLASPRDLWYLLEQLKLSPQLSAQVTLIYLEAAASNQSTEYEVILARELEIAIPIRTHSIGRYLRSTPQSTRDSDNSPPTTLPVLYDNAALATGLSYWRASNEVIQTIGENATFTRVLRTAGVSLYLRGNLHQDFGSTDPITAAQLVLQLPRIAHGLLLAELPIVPCRRLCMALGSLGTAPLNCYL